MLDNLLFKDKPKILYPPRIIFRWKRLILKCHHCTHHLCSISLWPLSKDWSSWYRFLWTNRHSSGKSLYPLHSLLSLNSISITFLRFLNKIINVFYWSRKNKLCHCKVTEYTIFNNLLNIAFINLFVNIDIFIKPINY